MADSSAVNAAYNTLPSLSAINPAIVPDTSKIVRSSRTFWVWVFSFFSPEDEFPFTLLQEPEAAGGGWGADWKNFAYVQALPSCCLLAVGVIVCVVLLVNLLCCNHYEVKGKRPSTHPIMSTVCSGMALLWISVFMSSGRGWYAYDMMTVGLGRLTPEVNFIASNVHDLTPKFRRTSVWMKNWEQSCPGWSNVPPNISAKVKEVNHNITSYYLDKVTGIFSTLDANISSIYPKVRAVEVIMRDIRSDWTLPITILVFTPAILATLVIGFIVHAVMRTGDHPRMARITNFLVLDLGAIPIVVVILLMTITAALLLFVGVNAGLYCSAYETNTVNLVSATQNGNHTSDITSLVEFYLKGPPTSNSIVETLRQVRSILNPLAPFVGVISLVVDFLGIFCKNLGESNLGQLLSEVTQVIEQILPMVKRQRIFEHYNDIVVMGMCDTFVASLGWYMICTIISGMVLLPVIAVQSHRYLSEVAHEKANEKKPLKAEEKSLMHGFMETETVKWDHGHNDLANKFKETGSRETHSLLGCCGRQSRPVTPA